LISFLLFPSSLSLFRKSIRVSFEREQWVGLQTQVNHWKDSISTLSDLLRQRNSTAAAAE
jgi:hypothetical protein